MNWAKLIEEINEHGLSQVEIASRIGRSQAWVSALLKSKYKDVSWSGGDALIKLHAEVTGVNKEAA